ncbi:hypothetical protein [Salinarimonas soli]|uniref:Uncharacterized protein n=1 Tax=Salinarimonas soli TaxID=1638099 RepID=A0A5B2VHW9_9HYPH|nr:hypothetical protein [Salinarimonas soli]KAA2238080.1 hypothetical protein F0L46_07375 [Salinarimonas soli]
MIRRTKIEVPCTVEIANTFDSLHAHVDLDGIEVGPGDEVIVHGAPTECPRGETLVVRRTATVIRANWLDRLKAKAEGYLEITELYEVGFEGRH